MRKIREDEVTFTLDAEQDTLPIRGNAMASGDDEADARAEAEVRTRLYHGDIWAWASVTVTAMLTLPDGTVVTGRDNLGGCNYANEEDFKQPGGYYDDMKHEALAALQSEVEYRIKTGALLASMFAED